MVGFRDTAATWQAPCAECHYRRRAATCVASAPKVAQEGREARSLRRGRSCVVATGVAPTRRRPGYLASVFHRPADRAPGRRVLDPQADVLVAFRTALDDVGVARLRVEPQLAVGDDAERAPAQVEDVAAGQDGHADGVFAAEAGSRVLAVDLDDGHAFVEALEHLVRAEVAGAEDGRHLGGRARFALVG